MSPEEYLDLMEELENARLFAMAEARLKDFDPEKAVPAEDIYKKLGITEDDLADFDEVELE